MDSKNFIIFPKLESKHIYIIIFVVSTLLRVLIPRIIETIWKLKYEKNEIYYKQICYFDMLTNFLGDFSVGIYILIKLIKKEEKNKITTEGIKTKRDMLKKFFIYLPIIALIDLLAQLCLFIFTYIDTKGTILGIGTKNGNGIINDEDLFFVVSIDILFRYIFSRILLNSSFYKHHYLSMILNAIGFIPLIIVNLKDLFSKYSDNEDRIKSSHFYLFLILYVIRTILYSLEDVFNKIALNKLLLRPYELMFYKAVFEAFPIIIISAISISDSGFSPYSSDNFTGIQLISRLLYRLFFIICNIFRTIALITIIEKLNPNHLSILKSSEFIALFLYIMIWDAFDKNSRTNLDAVSIVFESIACIILLLGSVIHNEMIIINKWGFLESTDYYKTEIKGFSNIDINFEEDTNKNNATQDSLLGESSQEING